MSLPCTIQATITQGAECELGPKLRFTNLFAVACELLIFSSMEGVYTERWQQLSKLVSEETDPDRFGRLVQELLEELRKKDERLSTRVSAASA